MKKLLISLSSIMLLCCSATTTQAIYGDFEEAATEEQQEIQKKIVLPKGSFFRGFIGQTVSSEYNNDNDIVKILITADFIIDNRIALPKHSLFVGKMKNVSKAQQGLDGSFSIEINSLLYPDGRYYIAKGYVVSKGDNKIFGGGFTKRTGHRDSLHRSGCFGRKGTLQLLQNGPRTVGKETKITMGDLVTIVLEEEIEIN